MNHWDVIIGSPRGDLTFSFATRDEAYTVWNVLSNQWRNGSLLLGSQTKTGHASLAAKEISRVTLMGVGSAVPQISQAAA